MDTTMFVVRHFDAATDFEQLVPWLRAKGAEDIELESWGDAEQTLALYGELGFTIVRQDRTYRRVLI